MSKTTSQKGSVSIILIIAAIFFVGGVVAVLNYVNSNQSTLVPIVEESRSERAQTAQSNGYPSLWTEAGLPEYPNGSLTKTRQGRDQLEGVQVTLESTDSMAIITDFWQTELASLGFTQTAGMPGTDYATIVKYNSGSKSLTLQVTKIGESSNHKIYLQYHE